MSAKVLPELDPIQDYSQCFVFSIKFWCSKNIAVPLLLNSIF